MVEFEINNKKYKRAFSISSSPRSRYIEFTVKKTHEPFVSKYLVDHAKIGEKITFEKPIGKFLLDEKNNSILFIAAGSGIAPIISMIRHVDNKKLKNKITLFYSNKTEQDILWKSELQRIAKNNTNISINFNLTNEKSKRYNFGRISKIILHDYFKKSPKEQTLCYLCGPLLFVKDMRKKLLNLGISSEKIKQEIYD